MTPKDLRVAIILVYMVLIVLLIGAFRSSPESIIEQMDEHPSPSTSP